MAIIFSLKTASNEALDARTKQVDNITSQQNINYSIYIVKAFLFFDLNQILCGLNISILITKFIITQLFS